MELEEITRTKDLKTKGNSPIEFKQDIQNSYFEVFSDVIIFSSKTITKEASHATKEADNKSHLSEIVITDNGIVNETWSLDSLLDSRVISIEGDIITLEYKNEYGEFEEMDFEKKRFNHFDTPIKMFDLVRIELLEKECGDYRVKILSGEGIVNPEIFDNISMFDDIPDDFFTSD